jgi:hypothetical protein
MADETLEAIRAELDTLVERLSDAAYDFLRAQVRRGTKPSKSDPDFVREKLLSRARNAVERASSLVAQAERAAGGEVQDQGADEAF